MVMVLGWAARSRNTLVVPLVDLVAVITLDASFRTSPVVATAFNFGSERAYHRKSSFTHIVAKGLVLQGQYLLPPPGRRL